MTSGIRFGDPRPVEMSVAESLEQQEEAMLDRVLAKLDEICARLGLIPTSPSASPTSTPSPAAEAAEAPPPVDEVATRAALQPPRANNPVDMVDDAVQCSKDKVLIDEHPAPRLNSAALTPSHGAVDTGCAKDTYIASEDIAPNHSTLSDTGSEVAQLVIEDCTSNHNPSTNRSTESHDAGAEISVHNDLMVALCSPLVDKLPRLDALICDCDLVEQTRPWEPGVDTVHGVQWLRNPDCFLGHSVLGESFSVRQFLSFDLIPARDILASASLSGTIHIGLDVGDGPETFALRMCECSVTVLASTVNLNEPFSAFIAEPTRAVHVAPTTPINRSTNCEASNLQGIFLCGDLHQLKFLALSIKAFTDISSICWNLHGCLHEDPELRLSKTAVVQMLEDSTLPPEPRVDAFTGTSALIRYASFTVRSMGNRTWDPGVSWPWMIDCLSIHQNLDKNVYDRTKFFYGHTDNADNIFINAGTDYTEEFVGLHCVFFSRTTSAPFGI